MDVGFHYNTILIFINYYKINENRGNLKYNEKEGLDR